MKKTGLVFSKNFGRVVASPLKFILLMLFSMWSFVVLADPVSFTLKSVVIEDILEKDVTIYHDPLICGHQQSCGIYPNTNTGQQFVLLQVRDSVSPSYTPNPGVAALKSSTGGETDCVTTDAYYYGPLQYNIQLYLQEPTYGRGKVAWETYLRMLRVAKQTHVPVTLGYLLVNVATSVTETSITVDCAGGLPYISGVDVVGGVEFH